MLTLKASLIWNYIISVKKIVKYFVAWQAKIKCRNLNQYLSLRCQPIMAMFASDSCQFLMSWFIGTLSCHPFRNNNIIYHILFILQFYLGFAPVMGPLNHFIGVRYYLVKIRLKLSLYLKLLKTFRSICTINKRKIYFSANTFLIKHCRRRLFIAF